MKGKWAKYLDVLKYWDAYTTEEQEEIITKQIENGKTD